MAKFKFENIWKIMENYDFSGVEVDSDMICGLCGKVMINSHNAPCGCRFCLDCISNYLNGRENLCPGNKDDCKLELISLEENIAIDRPMNNKISRLIIKCPENSCDYVDELRKIELHISQCNSQTIICPYIKIGCNESDVSLGKMPDHLRNDIHNHTKLLMDCIDNLNNEMNEIKIIVGNFKGQFDKNTNDQSYLAEIESKLQQQTMEIDLLKQRVHNLENLDFVDRPKLKAESLNNIISDNFRNYPNRLDTLNRNSTNPINLTAVSNKIDDAMKFGLTKLADMEINLKRMKSFEFVWKVDKFNDKMKAAKKGKTLSIFSDSFYTHQYGYKMCLQLFPNGNAEYANNYLSVFLCLMKSDLDDILEWPFRNHFTFSLINQRTRLPHSRSTTTYDNFQMEKCLDKPILERNVGYGYLDFMDLKELFNNDDWTRNDQIFIKFKVHSSL